MLLSLHPNIRVHVENGVSLFSCPSTSSQKVRKCGGHKFLSQAIECGQLVSFSLLDRILVNFYRCFSRVAQVCKRLISLSNDRVQKTTSSSGLYIGLQTLADADGEKLWKRLYFR